MTFIGNLLTGIVSGIIAATLLALLAVVFRKAVVPAVQDYLYEGPNIAGLWSIYYSLEKDAASTGKATIHQKGTLITGIVENYVSRSSGKPTTRSWVLEGKFRFGQMIATYEDVNSKGYVAGVVIVKLSADGSMMSGNVMYLHADGGEIRTFPFSFKRYHSSGERIGQ